MLIRLVTTYINKKNILWIDYQCLNDNYTFLQYIYLYKCIVLYAVFCLPLKVQLPVMTSRCHDDQSCLVGWDLCRFVLICPTV